MALTISIDPSQYYLVKNPMLMRIATDRYVVSAGVKAKVILNFSGTGAAAGQSIVFITQSGFYASMVFANVLDDSGLKIRTNIFALSLPLYIQQVAEDLASNYYLQDTFKITHGAASITLESKTVGADFNAVCFCTAAGISVGTVTAGADQQIAPNHRIRLDLYAETSYGSNSYKKISSSEEEPFPSYADFDISELLRWNFTKCDLPDFMELNVIRCRYALTRYYVVYSEKYGTPPKMQLATTTDKYFAFYGGTSYQEFPYQPLVFTHIWNQKQYLTWQPTQKDGYADSQDFLYFMVPVGVTSFRVKVVSVYTDNSTSTVYPFVRNGNTYEIFRIPTGFQQLTQIPGIFDAGKVVAYYDVLVDDSSATILAEKMRYKMQYRARYEKQLFIFSNSLAAMETIETTGELVTGIQVESFTGEHAAQYTYSVIDGETFKTYSEKQDVFKISTGWISKKRADKVIDELFLSDFVYIADPVKGQWLPVIINKGSVEKFKSQQDLIAVNFEFTYAFLNRVTEGTIGPTVLSSLSVTTATTTTALTTTSSQQISINTNYSQTQ